MPLCATPGQHGGEPPKIPRTVDVPKRWEDRTGIISPEEILESVTESKGTAPANVAEYSNLESPQADQVVSPVRAGTEDGVAENQLSNG